ncbi:Uncharacterised protein [uncultured archaeon]|nr:Uncharacterised protein [uncultured archaeon]
MEIKMVTLLDLVDKLGKIFLENKEKRIIVVGTTCTGKTFLTGHLKGSIDMDEYIFPLLTKKEKDSVCTFPWTPKIGQKMTSLVREKLKVKPGQPVFGTVVLDADLIIYLKIRDKLLKERSQLRKVNFEDAKNMQKQIESEIKKVNVPVIKIIL